MQLLLAPFWATFSENSPHIFVGLVHSGAELELINCNFASRMMRKRQSSTRGLKAMILGRREEDQERRKWANWTVWPSSQMAKATVK